MNTTLLCWFLGIGWIATAIVTTHLANAVRHWRNLYEREYYMRRRCNGRRYLTAEDLRGPHEPYYRR